jgi:hypothetical protein
MVFNITHLSVDDGMDTLPRSAPASPALQIRFFEMLPAQWVPSTVPVISASEKTSVPPWWTPLIKRMLLKPRVLKMKRFDLPRATTAY